ncbi:two pore domain potassium channel family protein [Halorubrum sp. BOL3-1]|uniref:potassium channel family protein n=1 Tax=Halorubrum sp. BOL3-1 TaxID=2497325 RepID=UPI001004D838|nr:potassium channel family protein [Halorubrum sp. BOL3-1]QAU11914.1 two pore domain potassium channel family protein [Halorubrum sp. BOL3-1]
MFHLTPAERRTADVTSSTLRAAFLADIGADDPSRQEYVDVHLEELDLSQLVVDGSDVAHITFREVTVDGVFDLSGSVVGHPMTIEECHIDGMDVSDTVFERQVEVRGTVLGRPSASTACFRARRGSFERSLRIRDTRFDGSVEFAQCSVREWLNFDSVTIGGRAHFANVSFGRAQFVSTAFRDDVEFVGAASEYATFDDIGVDESVTGIDLSEGSFERLRIYPATDIECRLRDATISAGDLDQPDTGVATYDLTDATVGDVDLECEPDTLDRYRFYRTGFDGFHFAAYRDLLRSNRWRIHEYIGNADESESVEGLEHTYLEAKQGASDAGDSETASMFFVRELRYRRRRYAAHAGSADHSLIHRVDATVRWTTNGFLDAVAGYGERPGRTAALALAVMVGSAFVYPASGGLSTGGEIVSYGSHGADAVLNGFYFSIVTFATLGLGDVYPVSDVGRFVAASEGLAGAFLTAVFVFSLARRVTR